MFCWGGKTKNGVTVHIQPAFSTKSQRAANWMQPGSTASSAWGNSADFRALHQQRHGDLPIEKGNLNMF